MIGVSSLFKPLMTFSRISPLSRSIFRLSLVCPLHVACSICFACGQFNVISLEVLSSSREMLMRYSRPLSIFFDLFGSRSNRGQETKGLPTLQFQGRLVWGCWSAEDYQLPCCAPHCLCVHTNRARNKWSSTISPFLIRNARTASVQHHCSVCHTYC